MSKHFVDTVLHCIILIPISMYYMVSSLYTLFVLFLPVLADLQRILQASLAGLGG